MQFSESLFATRFHITRPDLEKYLAEALSHGGDYADLYFEYLLNSSISIDESIVKSAAQGVTMGVGVRVIAGERTGYAYSDDLSPEKIRKAARVAACIAKGPSSVVKSGFEEAKPHNLYPMLTSPHEAGLAERVDLVRRADLAARAYDSRIFQVQATYADSLRHVAVATSEGRLSFDRQPMARMSVSALAREGNSAPQRGYSGGGGRVTLDFFLNEKTPEHFAREAARQAIVQLQAVDAPAGEMTVVLGPGWPGILLHEAVGHGLEADFNRKGVSAFSGRIGQQVASPLCTVIDDGTIGSRRGSLNVDDEGMPTQHNVLIENGVLRGYLQDKLSNDIKIDMPGDTTVAEANYASVVASIYKRAWDEEAKLLPDDIASDSSDTEVNVTIAPDGTVINAYIVSQPGDARVAAAVQRMLDRVKFIAPFSPGMTETNWNRVITFNLKDKQGF